MCVRLVWPFCSRDSCAGVVFFVALLASSMSLHWRHSAKLDQCVTRSSFLATSAHLLPRPVALFLQLHRCGTCSLIGVLRANRSSLRRITDRPRSRHPEVQGEICLLLVSYVGSPIDLAPIIQKYRVRYVCCWWVTCADVGCIGEAHKDTRKTSPVRRIFSFAPRLD